MHGTQPQSLPRHVAIIMDGNGRWARSRGLPRTMGHRQGVEAVREAVRVAGELGIGYLTLFAFSSENWNRPPDEVRDLMGLLRLFIRRDLAELHRENVRIRVVGDPRLSVQRVGIQRALRGHRGHHVEDRLGLGAESRGGQVVEPNLGHADLCYSEFRNGC